MENRNVWVDVDSHLIPPSIPVWTRALEAVNKDKLRVRPDLPPSERGFTFPDPNSLAGLRPDQQAKKLVAWLSLRPGTCSKAFVAAGLKPPAGSGAVWRSVLNVDSKTLIPDDTRHHENGKEFKTSRVAAAIKQLFGQELLDTLQGGLQSVQWHDIQIPVHDNRIIDLDSNVVKEIIWELFEHNFRFEVRALDMIAAPSKWDNAVAAIKRVEHVASVIGNGFKGKFVIWNDPIPHVNEGLRAVKFQARSRALEGLRLLMLSWPNVPPLIVNQVVGIGLPVEFEAFEYQIVLFYCQTFFDFFGRPPIVPHRLPIRSDN
jgi:hypothetical protein